MSDTCRNCGASIPEGEGMEGHCGVCADWAHLPAVVRLRASYPEAKYVLGYFEGGDDSGGFAGWMGLRKVHEYYEGRVEEIGPDTFHDAVRTATEVVISEEDVRWLDTEFDRFLDEHWGSFAGEFEVKGVVVIEMSTGAIHAKWETTTSEWDSDYLWEPSAS